MSNTFVYPPLRSTRNDFKCPNCARPLLQLDEQPQTWRCDNNHSFDMAREGYLNLLLAQRKRSRNPGDSDEMMRSRQRFLAAGYYRPLSDAIVHAVVNAVGGVEQRVVDLGCGEGHYLQQLRDASSELTLLGMDISKLAVQLAAKRKMNALLAVDSVFNIPLFDDNIDTAISVFSPISADETARILKPGGTLIMVGPGEEHLSGLTALIYQQNVPHRGNHQVLENTPQFALQQQLEIKQSIVVNDRDILDLLKMTPYYWHSRPEQQQMLAELDKLETIIHFYINIYHNQSG